MMDDSIRKLAEFHGHPLLTDDQVAKLKAKLANAHLDTMLDKQAEGKKEED